MAEDTADGANEHEMMDAVSDMARDVNFYKKAPNLRPLPTPRPTPTKPGKPKTYDIAKAYLDSLHCTLWPAEAWYIRDEDGQDAAAVWITKMVDTVNAIRNMVTASESMTVQQAAEDYRRMTEEGLI